MKPVDCRTVSGLVTGQVHATCLPHVLQTMPNVN